MLLEKKIFFLKKELKFEFATLNANDGPIYIGKDAEIMEGSPSSRSIGYV